MSSCFDKIVNAFINHGWFFVWVVFFAAIIYAFHEHGEHAKKVRESKGWSRAKAVSKLILLWALPILALLGAIASQLWADRADRTFETLGINFKDSTNKLAQAVAEEAALKAAIPPRQISEIQREVFIEVLIDTNNISPKIPIKVIVGDTDQETEDFARDFRKMLNDAGYGTNVEEIVKKSDLEVHQSNGKNDRRIPPIVAIFSSQTSDIPPPTMPNFGSIMMMIPSRDGIVQGEKGTHPRAYRYTENPNDILYGISSVIGYAGFPPGQMSGYGILNPGEVAFFIPKQVP